MALVDEQAVIRQNTCVGLETYLMELKSPRIAAQVQPGQFVHMKIPTFESHILRRPFSVYARNCATETIEILYRVVGAGTDHMTTLEAGSTLDLIGALGCPWNPPSGAGRVLLVGGGVGAAPLYMLCENLVDAGAEVDVVLGAQTEAALVCRDRFETLIGHDALCATDDGTFGRAGFCISLVIEELDRACTNHYPYDYVATCGPTVLMHAVADAAREAGTTCEVSMEARMACGIGACLSCAVDTTSGKKRSCVDGPIFNAEEIIW